LLRANAHYLAATALAVEAAVLHNFAWHQRYTWADRPCDSLSSVLFRLLRFHLSNGVVSISGNVLLMHWLVGNLRIPPLAANFLAILVCSVVNYFLGDRFVFRGTASPTVMQWKQRFPDKCDLGSETPDTSSHG
jgi:putative flippase GtrA